MYKPVNYNLGVAFDASHVKGRTADYKEDLDFHNLESTRHAEHLEFDYSYFRDRGINFFRDGSLMYKTCPRPNEYNWDYLDRVAKQEGNIQISLSHYEFPAWLSREDILQGKFADFLELFACEFADRYKDRFHSVIPCVEIGYWCHMISSWGRWHPFVENWWNIYTVVMDAVIASARVLRDFKINVALSEPFGLETPLNDQARPFLTLLGHDDKVAEENNSHSFKNGRDDLLQILGLNYYRLDTIKSTTEELRAFLPYKEILIAETGNCHNQHISPDEWLTSLDNLGKVVDTVIWSPAVEMSNFEFGDETGGYLLARDGR